MTPQTLATTQGFACLQEGKFLKIKIDELQRKEHIISSRTKCWLAKASQLSEIVDSKLKVLRQTQREAIQKTTEETIEKILFEVREAKKNCTKTIQPLKDALRNIKANTHDTLVE